MDKDRNPKATGVSYSSAEGIGVSRFVYHVGLVAALLGFVSCATPGDRPGAPSERRAGIDTAQVPGWSREDLQFFLHGSMGTEVVPERVLRAFARTYPDLFPRPDLSHFGLIPDPAFGWPVGFSRRPVPHLGGLSAVGVNCASCHVAEIVAATGGAPVRVLGPASHFDAEAFFGAVTVATFRTADPANMKRFLSDYLATGEPTGGEAAQQLLAGQWQRQEPRLVAVIAGDPFGSKGIASGALYEIAGTELSLDRAALEGGMDLVPLVRAVLRLFHNMRAALHIPDQPPDKVPPASGPGRNDAFGLLSAGLLGAPQPYAPVKYGVAWNLEGRPWVHWDGNTQSPIGRNLLASLGLGAPLVGKRGHLDFAMVARQTELSEKIRAPRYPFTVDQAAARRGAALYQARCASCHEGPESDARLHAPEAVGTEPSRARLFTQTQAERLNTFLAELEIPGYRPSGVSGIRGTQKYWAPGLAGVWARAPYLHNGSVRTIQELLTPPAARAKSFRRDSQRYDTGRLGYIDEGPYVLDTTTPGNSNAGH
ncbi:MAG: cytochrome c, partial [Dehalococcoidia bacterium]|nr:cytochrome c [Dehalococcoidia bacterium]